MRLSLLLLLAGLALAPVPSGAGPPQGLDELAPGESGQVAEVVDGDTLILDTGLEVRLAGIQAPKLPLGRAGFVEWPLADAAKAALARLGAGRELRLRYGGRRRDHYRRALAHLFAADGTWIQGELLRQGMARVYTHADNRAAAGAMLGLERAARTARRGIWALPWYRVRNPGETGSDIDSFQLVEGRVVAAAAIRGRFYLNFGPDWRRDFTFTIARRAAALFRRAGIDLAALAGRRVRGRGWVVARNGPMIRLDHPEQIEILED